MKKNTINPEWLYQKLRPHIFSNEDLNIITINTISYYRRLEKLAKDQQNGDNVRKTQRRFAVFEKKMKEILQTLKYNGEWSQDIIEIRNKIKNRKQQIQVNVQLIQKKQEKQELLMMNLKKKSSSSSVLEMKQEAKQVQKLHQQIEQDLLMLSQHLKKCAQQVNQNLKEDQKIFQNIRSSQSFAESFLKKTNSKILQMLNNPNIGWIELIMMIVISIAAFVVTGFFILLI